VRGYCKLVLVLFLSLLLTSCVIHKGFQICFNKRCVYGKLYDKYLKLKINIHANIYTVSKKLKRNRSNKKGDAKLNQGTKTGSNHIANNSAKSSLKKDSISSQSNTSNGSDSLKRTNSVFYSKSDSASIQSDLRKENLNLKSNQNLIIHYPFDVAQLSGLDKENILQEISRNDITKITITGYTDSIGGDGIYNKQLSFKRAKIISQYLLDLGVQKNKIFYNGLSSKSPLSDNITEQGRWLNRRTEILIEYLCK
jgi:outer membrane protein OmpA-like peptidoglycan-associated protein